MRKSILIGFSALLLIVATISVLPHLVDMLMFFVLAGAIPGTTHSIGAGWMLAGALGLAALLVAHLMIQAFSKNPQLSGNKRSPFSDNLPTKRFHQI